MKLKSILIGSALGISLQGIAQTDITNLNEVVVSDNRIEIPISKTSRSIEVLSAKKIEALPINQTQELLTLMAGVDLRQRGAHGIQSDISIRGGNFEQSLVMINRMKLTDPQTGHHTMNLPLPLFAIKQVEVHKGTAASRFGQNAFSGAVNFVTEIPEKNRGIAYATAADFSTFRIGAGGNFKIGKIKHLLFAENSRSTGYRKNSDYNLTQVYYQNELAVNQYNSISLTGAYTQREFGAGGFYVPNSNEYEEVKTGLVGLNHKYQKENLSLKGNAYYRINDDHYVFLRNAPEVFQNFHLSQTFNADYNATYNWKKAITAIGVEAHHADLESTNLGDRNRTVLGIYGEHRMYFAKLLVHPAIYGNYNTDWGFDVFPSLDLAYELTGNASVYGNVGTSLRAPSYTDLYYQGRTNIGNVNLKPEEAISYELGYKFSKQKLLINAVVFRRDASKLIDWVQADSLSPWQPQNFYNVLYQGAELSFSLTDVVMSKIKLPEVYLSYTYIDADLVETAAFASQYNLSNLKHQLIARVTNKITNDLIHSVAFRWLQRGTLPSYSILDYKISYNVDKLNFYLALNNALDNIYSESGYATMPGRVIGGGVVVRF